MLLQIITGMPCFLQIIPCWIIQQLHMKPYKIIDVHTSFLCTDSFQQAPASDNESNEDDFFIGYEAAEKYLSLDFDYPLNRLVVIPTGAKEMFVKNKTDRKVRVMKFQ